MAQVLLPLVQCSQASPIYSNSIIMNTDQNKPVATKQGLSMNELFHEILKHRRLYYKVMSITFVLAVIYVMSLPNTYRCTVMLAPELSSSSRSGSLASIASSFGIKLGSGSMGNSEALFPTLYPDLMNSVAFRTSLFSITVQREDDSTHTVMTYYDYLKDCQKRPWWSMGIQAVFDGIKSLSSQEENEKGKPAEVDPFRLTKKQYAIARAISNKIVCKVDKKTLVIRIDVVDQDPLIAATIADSVQVRLQKFITDYRTHKARIDLEYNQKLFVEAQERYEEARQRSAAFSDANQKLFLESVLSERTKLENEMQLQYRTYSQISAQLQLAEAKVQEETPAFTILQPASVPLKKSGPDRKKIVLAFLFLGFIGTTAYMLYKEDELIPFLKGLGGKKKK